MAFTVPANATSGKVVLTTNGKEITWPVDFKVLSATVSTYADLGSNYIEHIAFDRNGIAYGEYVDKVFRISQSGAVTLFKDGSGGKPFKFIWGIAADAFNEVYVPDALDHRIYKIQESGVPRILAGNGIDGVVDGVGPQVRFGAPRGIARDLSGNLYITDVHRVRKISTSAEVTTIAGSDNEGSVDGKGAAAQFGALDGIAVDTAGNIYVSDRRYYNIRKIRPDGTVTTLAGSGTAGMTDGQGTQATFNDPREWWLITRATFLYLIKILQPLPTPYAL
ncbi:hypothetical protein [Mucilaginibacter antarcticus]|uniref:hypothetical protein n=1 Tax=Mucilaginibacter antarcticus TaxID=1855725 RepID=UPI003644958D